MATTKIRSSSIEDGQVSNADLSATIAVTGGQIADDAVTLAKMADGTQGDTLYYGVAGAPTLLAKPGTPADEVLTFATGASAPSWVAAGGGGLVALRVYTAASTTWSKSTNDPTKIIVEVIAGGGGTGAGAYTGGSGAAGAYAKVFLDVSTVDTATVTVGAAGLGGSSSGAGGVGGTSKFTYLSGTGSFTEIECVGGNGGGLYAAVFQPRHSLGQFLVDQGFAVAVQTHPQQFVGVLYHLIGDLVEQAVGHGDVSPLPISDGAHWASGVAGVYRFDL